MNQKGFINVIVVVLGVIILGTLGYFVFIRKQELVSQRATNPPTVTIPSPTPQTTTSTSTNEVAGWKTYRNEKYGYRFSYPQKFAVVQHILKNPQELGNTVHYEIKRVATVGLLNELPNVSAGISVVTSEDVGGCYQISTARGDYTSTATTSTANGIVFHIGKGGDVASGNIIENEVYATVHSNICYQIVLEMDYSRDTIFDSTKAENYLKQIVSTFQFIPTAISPQRDSYSLTVDSITPTSVHVGDSITITGKGFVTSPPYSYNGVEYHQVIVNVILKPSNLVSGVVWSGNPSSDTSFAFTLPNQVCSLGGGTGVDCAEYKTLTPGQYELTVSVPNELYSVPLKFTVE